MGLPFEKRRQKLESDLKRMNAILHGSKIPEWLRGNEIRPLNGETTKNDTDYEGHFLLPGGDHIDTRIDLHHALGISSVEETIGDILKYELQEKGIITSRDMGFDLIVGPVRGALIIGRALLKALGNPQGVKDVYAQRSEGGFILEYPFRDRREVRTLLVDDTFMRGESIRKTIEACYAAERKKNAPSKQRKGLKEKPASFYFIGGAVGINRAPDKAIFLRNTITFWIGSALEIPAQIWPAEKCDLCNNGVPLYQP